MIEIRHRQDSERQGQRKAESKVERFQSSLSDASDDVVATDDKSPTSEQLKFETYDLKPRGMFRISDSVPNHGWHIKWVVSEITLCILKVPCFLANCSTIGFACPQPPKLEIEPQINAGPHTSTCSQISLCTPATCLQCS